MRLLRHPRTLAPAGLCYGRFEPPLPPGAIDSLAPLCAELRDVRTIISSPATRCARAAEFLADALGCRLLTDARLLELNFGAWEGLEWANIDRAESDYWSEDPVNRAPPGGETFGALCERVTAALADAASHAAPMLVTHAGPIRAAWMHAEGRSFAEAFATQVPFARPLSLGGPR